MNKEFLDCFGHNFEELCYLTDLDEYWTTTDLTKVSQIRDSIFIEFARNKVAGIEDEDISNLLRYCNFIVRTIRFVNIPFENWKYGLRKYREKRSIYNYIVTPTSIIIIGQEPSSRLEYSIYDKNTQAGQILLNYLPAVTEDQFLSDSIWQDRDYGLPYSE